MSIRELEEAELSLVAGGIIIEFPPQPPHNGPIIEFPPPMEPTVPPLPGVFPGLK